MSDLAPWLRDTPEPHRHSQTARTALDLVHTTLVQGVNEIIQLDTLIDRLECRALQQDLSELKYVYKEELKARIRRDFRRDCADESFEMRWSR